MGDLLDLNLYFLKDPDLGPGVNKTEIKPVPIQYCKD